MLDNEKNVTLVTHLFEAHDVEELMDVGYHPWSWDLANDGLLCKIKKYFTDNKYLVRTSKPITMEQQKKEDRLAKKSKKSITIKKAAIKSTVSKKSGKPK